MVNHRYIGEVVFSLSSRAHHLDRVGEQLNHGRYQHYVALVPLGLWVDHRGHFLELPLLGYELHHIISRKRELDHKEGGTRNPISRKNG